MIQLINSGQFNTSGITVTPATYAAGTIVEDRINVGRNQTENIAAGAYRVRVDNVGTVDITVNGDTVEPGSWWERVSRVNEATTKQDFVGAVAVVTPDLAGAEADINTEFPSA